MSNLVDLYNSSDKLRPRQSREQIPGGGTDFFDREKKFAAGFTPGREKLGPSEFTKEGLGQYDAERAELTPPPSFNPELPLHRYTPEDPFFAPGAPPS